TNDAFAAVTDFGDSSVNLQLSLWCRREVFRELKSELMIAIKESFDGNNIEIPFPHISLYSGSESKPFVINQRDK
ncbi:MAG: hypothetical protein ACRBBW_01795, partial [Cellvibrionaceae bacterium]